MNIQGVPDQNPMLNHVVLERVFELTEFDKNSFANYRLVCKLWNETSLPTWRKSAWLSVTTDRHQRGVHVKDYLQLLKSPENRLVAVPFRKYNIRDWRGVINSHSHTKQKPERLEFWKTMGPLMNHLDISFSDFSLQDNFRKVIFELTPNLQYLALREIQLSGPDFLTQSCSCDPQKKGFKVNQHLTELIVSEWTLGSPVPLIELLWHFPNIKNLESLETDPTTATWFLFGLLDNVEYVRNTVGSHYLKNLVELRLVNLEKKRRNYLTLHHACALQRLQFPLKVLALDVGSEQDDGDAKEMLQIVLETHANTLEELTLPRLKESVQFPDFPFEIQFPKLNKFRSTGKLVQNLEFLKDMPNLKFLFLEEEGQEIRLSKVGSSNSFVNTNLKEFKITDKFCTDEELNFLGEIMPNLTNITLGLSNKECFKSICRIWKEVTILNINTRDVDEDAYWKTEDANEYITTSIRNLKELKSLNLGKFIEYLI